MSFTELEEGLALAIILPFVAFWGYYYFMLNTLTHNIKNSLLLPTEFNFAKEMLKFLLVGLDLFFYLLWQIEPMNNDLIWYFLILNGVFLVIYFLSIKTSKKAELNQYYLTYRKADLGLSILILSGVIVFSLLSLWNNFIILPLSTVYAIYIAVKVNKFLDVNDSTKVIFLSIAIIGITNIIFWLSMSISYTTKAVVEFLSLSAILTYLPTIFFGIHIAVMLNLKFYNMCQKLTFISTIPAESSQESYLSQDTLSQTIGSDTKRILNCPQCKTNINNSIIQQLNENYVLFCPHCGTKIFQKDLSMKSSEDIYMNHQNVMKSLNNISEEHTRLKKRE